MVFFLQSACYRLTHWPYLKFPNIYIHMMQHVEPASAPKSQNVCHNEKQHHLQLNHLVSNQCELVMFGFQQRLGAFPSCQTHLPCLHFVLAISMTLVWHRCDMSTVMRPLNKAAFPTSELRRSTTFGVCICIEYVISLCLSYRVMWSCHVMWGWQRLSPSRTWDAAPASVSADSCHASCVQSKHRNADRDCRFLKNDHRGHNYKNDHKGHN